MEIIEKEKIVEHQDGYYGPNKRDINGKANAGLTLGIIGTALGAWALFGNRRAGLLGGSGLGSGLGGANINIRSNIEEQIQLLEKQKQLLENAKQQRMQQMTQPQVQQPPQKLIWDEIDSEIEPMTDEQKNMLFQDEDYVDTYNKLQSLVQAEILSLVKGRIEGTQEGKDLLTHQLKIVKKLKGKIIDTTNKEMEMFRRFREFSKSNPNVTYEEFIKANM